MRGYLGPVMDLVGHYMLFTLSERETVGGSKAEESGMMRFCFIHMTLAFCFENCVHQDQGSVSWEAIATIQMELMAAPMAVVVT